MPTAPQKVHPRGFSFRHQEPAGANQRAAHPQPPLDGTAGSEGDVNMRLDDTIAAAAVRAVASHTEWEQKHHPVRIDGKTYWLSTDIPRTIQDTLDVLPKAGEKSDVKRANQIKTRLSDVSTVAFQRLRIPFRYTDHPCACGGAGYNPPLPAPLQ